MIANPTISRKTDQLLTPTNSARRLFQVIYREKYKEAESSAEEVPKIKVSELISRMAFYYEKIRNSVEYKEEHLLRKNAVLRILKRLLLIEGAIRSQKGEEVARGLLVELIRAGYLPNNKLPESKIDEVSLTIEKYLKLNKLTANKTIEEKYQKNLTGWILAMCACEIEEKLSTSAVPQAIVNYMYEILLAEIKLPDNSLYKNDKEIQIYIGIHQIYLKFDQDMIEFLLLKYYNANWNNGGDEEINKVANSFNILRTAIDNQINHPLTPQLNRIINRYTVFFTILNDVVEDDPAGVYESIKEDPLAFPRLIKKFCSKRYKEAKAKLRRAAIRSIIYIFITKMLLVFILEVPVTMWLSEPLNYGSLAINVTFPPFLLFLIVLFTRVPSEANTDRIIEGIDSVVYEEKQLREPIQLRPPRKRQGSSNTVFGFFYAITFFLSFGLVIYILNKIQFNFVSILIFLFFLTLVSYFGIRIRRGAREMFIIDRKENIITFFVDFFYVPIVAVGKWLNEKFSRINVFVFVLDFIIEAPFKIFVDIAEDWTKYVRERKEEIM